ncbi:hypothetical protein BDW74DRAFT_175262 [Aspergillus multicolor]|uniref:uncharacterized protein n=1 Tax=Aspergillus multicolor TaxID=41759 RepID=UPI003CCDF2D3
MTWWDDFSNNLATDLAPFVSLFGENPTKQHLSECLTPVDAVIFAIAPLGVITAMVSVIRVCGPPSLRAFIGRAQEGAGTAEAELCSSTSREVCELYNNGGIARVFGRPKILEFVHDPTDCRPQTDKAYCASKPTENGWGTGIYTFKDYLSRDMDRRDWYDSMWTERYKFAPNPNLTINIGIRAYSPWVSAGVAVIGSVLQLGLLAWAAVAHYRLGWARGDVQNRYAVPTLITGTGLLAIGMAMCVLLIDGSTTERVFKRRKTRIAQSRIYWVQPGTQFVGDQAFDAFAFSHPDNTLNRYTTSWKDNRQPPKTFEVCVSVTFTAVGLILQFLGLRACHSSIAVAQLGLTLLMSTARSSLRSNRLSETNVFLADDAEYYAGYELDWLALVIGHWDRPNLRWYWRMARGLPCNSLSHTTTELECAKQHYVHLSWCNDTTSLLSGFALNPRIIVMDNLNSVSALPGNAQMWRYDQYFHPGNEDSSSTRSISDNAAVFLYRARLAYLAKDWGPQLVKLRSMARSLSLAMEATINLFYDTDTTLVSGWKNALLMFWAFPCEVTESAALKRYFHSSLLPEHRSTANGQPGYVRLALSRGVYPLGTSTAGASGGWETDASELEAILGLMAWSRVGGPGASHEIWVERVVDVHHREMRDDEKTWFKAWGKIRGSHCHSVASLTPQLASEYGVFGAHHIPSTGPMHDSVTSIDTQRLGLNPHNLHSLLAQEIYSFFFALLLNIVEDIGGETKLVNATRMVNSNVERIQQAFTDTGLGTPQDALERIFPALVNQGKLPKLPSTSS